MHWQQWKTPQKNKQRLRVSCRDKNCIKHISYKYFILYQAYIYGTDEERFFHLQCGFVTELKNILIFFDTQDYVIKRHQPYNPENHINHVTNRLRCYQNGKSNTLIKEEKSSSSIIKVTLQEWGVLGCELLEAATRGVL